MLRIDPLGPPESTRTYVFSFDDKYAKYFSVALQSLISHARADYLYDIIVLHDCVSQRNSSVLQGSIPGNFSLRFFNVGDLAFISRIVFGHLSQNSSHALAQFFLQVGHIL